MHWEDPEESGGDGGEGGLGWGIHVNPWLTHVNAWQKPLQYCKVISLQLIKINGKKNLKEEEEEEELLLEKLSRELGGKKEKGKIPRKSHT